MSSTDPSTPPRWQILVGIEAFLLLIALVMPITPSRTGSDWSPAELLFEAPTYAHDVAVYWLFGNVVMVILAGIVCATVWWEKRGKTRSDSGGPG